MKRIQLKNGDIVELTGFGVSYMHDNSVKVSLRFKKEIDLSEIIGKGFTIYDENGNEHDFTDCKYQYNIYNPCSSGVIMTNKKDYHDRPAKSLTKEQQFQLLNDAKQNKISQLSEQCQQRILNGVSINIDGQMEHFSYSFVDQNNIDDLFNVALATNMPQPYHCDGGNYKLYNIENVKQLYRTQKLNKIRHTTYFNQVKLWLLTLQNIEAVEAVEYGVELTGKYLNTYNELMEQSKQIILSFGQ